MMLIAEIEGLGSAAQMFSNLHTRGQNPVRAFEQSETYMYSMVNARFHSGGPGWVSRKNEEKYDYPPLLRTSRLLQAVTGDGIHRRSIGPRVSQSETGTSLRYAGYQQHGTYDKSTSPDRKGIAPRPFLFYEEANMTVIEDIFWEFLLSA